MGRPDRPGSFVPRRGVTRKRGWASQGHIMLEWPLPWRVGFTPGLQVTRPLAASCFCHSFVPTAGIEPATPMGTTFWVWRVYLFRQDGLFGCNAFHNGLTHNVRTSMKRVLLPCRDSNAEYRNQNPMCYRYTTRQNLFFLSTAIIAITFAN